MLLAAELLAAGVILNVLSHRDESQRVADRREVVLQNLAGSAGEALLTRVKANLDDAVRAVDTFWGADWPRRITLTATGSARQFAALAGEPGDIAQWSDVAAVAVADRVEPARHRASGQRVVFAPGAASMSTPALRIVLTHELFHYAARADTALDAPRWLTEGVADFVARPAPASNHLVAPAALPNDADLDAPGPQRTRAYDQAWAFARFVAARFGTAKLRALYLAACGDGHVAPLVAVRRVLGVTLADLLDDWRRWEA